MNTTDEIVCIARLTVKEECIEEALTIFQSMLELSRREEGCLSYTLQRDMENPLAFTFVDCFKDKTAFDFHCAQDYIIEYFDNRLPKLTTDIRLELYNKVEAI